MASRRRFLARTLTAATAGVAGCARLSDDETTTTQRGADRPTSVATERVADGFTSPVTVEQPPGDDRLFVADQAGRLVVVRPDGTTARYLDLRERIVPLAGYTEQGFLGLAFHPDFQSNGRFYVRYSAPPRAGTPSDYSHTAVLSEFTVDPNASRASLDSERTVLEVPEPQSNHNGGALAFGPDANLYVGLGDGGAANDQGLGHVDDWYVGTAGGNGQDVTENLLGSVLRIDPLDADPYGVPDDNPLVGRTGLDEHYAWGFRNPWRMSFDGDTLYAADVGQNTWEEVDRVAKGGNYGWNVREGAHCFLAEACPTQTPRGTPLRPPVLEYPHGDAPVSGIAIVGGYVARNGALPGFDGVYVFADWRANGRLFAADASADPLWDPWVVDVTDAFGTYVLGFGRDCDGRLYVCTSENSTVSGETGAVYRLTN